MQRGRNGKLTLAIHPVSLRFDSFLARMSLEVCQTPDAVQRDMPYRDASAAYLVDFNRSAWARIAVGTPVKSAALEWSIEEILHNLNSDRVWKWSTT